MTGRGPVGRRPTGLRLGDVIPLTPLTRRPAEVRLRGRVRPATREAVGVETGQAFVIMQIGDPCLDGVYERAIVPALRACGLVVKRVDRHNAGGLLHSEIISFIEESDLIVADLTHERPNCYLEVGYALGIGRFTELILTARDDHNPDSPDHESAGPKVHFDLIGYEILFWKPERLLDFRLELEKRVQRRLRISSGSR